MNQWAEIASFEPDGDGGYIRREPWGTVHLSDRGMQEMIDHANQVDRYGEALELVRQTVPVCEHGVPTDAEEFTWMVNDYVECWPVCPWFMLWRFHWDLPGQPFCVPIEAHGLPHGSVVVEMAA